MSYFQFRCSIDGWVVCLVECAICYRTAEPFCCIKIPILQESFWIRWNACGLVQHFWKGFWPPFIISSFRRSFGSVGSFAWGYQEFPLNIVIITAFIVILEVEIKIDKVVVVDGFDVFVEFSKSRFKACHSVSSKIFQIVHETFALVVN